MWFRRLYVIPLTVSSELARENTLVSNPDTDINLEIVSCFILCIQEDFKLRTVPSHPTTNN